MKTFSKKSAILLLITVVMTCILSREMLGEKEIHQPHPFSDKEFVLDDLTAEIHSDGNVVIVRGNIRNLRRTSVRGYVNIYFRDGEDVIIHTIDAEVNKNRPFVHGQRGHFEISENIEKVPRIDNVSIEFVLDDFRSN